MLMNEGLDVSKLREHDAVFITNPTSEDFTHNFNGEPYTIKAGEVKSFSKFVTFHLAKHLSTKIITKDLEAKMTKKEREDRAAPIHGKIAQLNIYDTHERRIALYRILGNKDLAQMVIAQYPFKGFIGEMSEYEEFVRKSKDSDTKSSAPQA